MQNFAITMPISFNCIIAKTSKKREDIHEITKYDNQNKEKVALKKLQQITYLGAEEEKVN